MGGNAVGFRPENQRRSREIERRDAIDECRGGEEVGDTDGAPGGSELFFAATCAGMVTPCNLAFSSPVTLRPWSWGDVHPRVALASFRFGCDATREQ